MTSSLEHLPRRDIERLSAYLDDELSPDERRRLEARMGREPALQASLEELRTTIRLLRALPQVEAPRSYSLTPEMVGERRGWRAFPVLQMATAVAALAFMVVLGLDVTTTSSFSREVGLPATGAQAPLQLAAPAGDEVVPAEEPEAFEAQAEAVGEAAGMAEPEQAPAAADQVEGEERALSAQGTVGPLVERESVAEDAAATAPVAPTATQPPPTETPSPEPTPPPTVTLAAAAAESGSSAPTYARTTGRSRSLLRAAELALALLVIVLAAVTYRLRPQRR